MSYNISARNSKTLVLKNSKHLALQNFSVKNGVKNISLKKSNKLC